MPALEPSPRSVPISQGSTRGVRRRRQAKKAVSAILRTTAAIDEALIHAVDAVPEDVIDYLSAASVSLEACLRSLTRREPHVARLGPRGS